MPILRSAILLVLIQQCVALVELREILAATFCFRVCLSTDMIVMGLVVFLGLIRRSDVKKGQAYWHGDYKTEFRLCKIAMQD